MQTDPFKGKEWEGQYVLKPGWGALMPDGREVKNKGIGDMILNQKPVGTFFDEEPSQVTEQQWEYFLKKFGSQKS